MMDSSTIQITYNGPFRQLTTAPGNCSITVRDICTDRTTDSHFTDNMNKGKTECNQPD